MDVNVLPSLNKESLLYFNLQINEKKNNWFFKLKCFKCIMKKY